MTFGQKLRKLIDARGYSITYVADCIGVSDRTLRNWLAGKGRPQKQEFYGRICDFFHITERYLMEDVQFDPISVLHKVKNIEDRLTALEEKVNKENSK